MWPGWIDEFRERNAAVEAVLRDVRDPIAAVPDVRTPAEVGVR